MKLVSVAEAKKTFADILRNSQTEEIIVTKHGKPIARIEGIEGTDINDLMNKKKHVKMLLDRLQGPSTPIEQVYEEFGLKRKK